MMRGLLLFLISFLSIASNFEKFSVQDQVIEGVACPRKNPTLYRGSGKSIIPVKTAIAAIFGDKNSFIESYYFSKIKYKLMGKNWKKRLFSLDENFSQKVAELIASNGGTYKEDQAKVLAKKLLDEYFNQTSDNYVINRYIDYKSETWNDWPKKILFSSILSGVSAHYGQHIVSFKEKTPRSLDLGCWNKVKNDIWQLYNKDTGEFNVPSYIPGSDIIGLEVRILTKTSYASKPDVTGKRRRRFYGKIDWAFYKTIIDHKTYIIVVDADESKCLKFDGQYTVNHCRHYKEGKYYLNKTAEVLGSRPNVIAIVSQDEYIPIILKQQLPVGKTKLSKRDKKILKNFKEYNTSWKQ